MVILFYYLWPLACLIGANWVIEVLECLSYYVFLVLGRGQLAVNIRRQNGNYRLLEEKNPPRTGLIPCRAGRCYGNVWIGAMTE